MTIDNKQVSTKLLWVDLEMTGLDTDHHVIVEIAAKVTDWNFTTLATYDAIITHPEDVLARSHPWALDQHTKSGLMERIRHDGRSEADVITEFVQFIHEHFGEEPAVLAGNSIHSDRSFIKKWWPEVNALLHYRMLDVSSWKLVMQGKYNVAFDKGETHRAEDDIQESIAELQFYLDWLKQHGDAL